MTLHKTIATFFGIGYIRKGGGSVAAAVFCLLLVLIVQPDFKCPDAAFGIFTIGVTLLGVYSAGKVETLWGKDSYRVVIDEVAGMAVTLLFMPLSPVTLAAGFVLFRFFDIIKPLGIRRLEKLKGGWGVMLDDVLAGVYANLVLRGLLLITGNFYENLF